MHERSAIYREALDAFRHESTDAILERVDAWGFLVADTATFGEVERCLYAERLRAAKDELTRRETLSRVNAGLSSPTERRYQAWRDLAATVRERADVLRVLDIHGYVFLHRQGAKEAHAPCPLCGGKDRLVITAGPPDRCWCRRCEWHGDVIEVTKTLRQCGFRDAVTWLASLYGESIAA